MKDRFRLGIVFIALIVLVAAFASASLKPEFALTAMTGAGRLPIRGHRTWFGVSKQQIHYIREQILKRKR